MHSTCRAAIGGRSLSRHSARSEALRPALFPSPLAWAINKTAGHSPAGFPARVSQWSPLQPSAHRIGRDSRPYSTTASISALPPEPLARRGLLDWLQGSPARERDTSAFGLALKDALAHGARLRASTAAASTRATSNDNQPVPEGPVRQYNERRREAVVGGKLWSDQKLLQEYASLDVAIDSVDQAMAVARDGSHATCAALDLPDLLQELDLDHDLFVAWQNVLSAPNVRAAVVLFQQQTSPLSMSNDGQPLWPPWLLKAVVDRADSVAEGHLAIAAIAHHLPYLSTGSHLQFTAEMIRVAARLDMVTALPVLVDLALRVAPEAQFVDGRRGYLNKLLRNFAFSQTYGMVNQPSVNAEVVRVLDTMIRSEPEVVLEQSAFDYLFQAPFLATAELHDLLLIHIKRYGIELKTRHVFAVLERASVEGNDAMAARCIQAIETQQALDKLRTAHETKETADILPVYFTPASVRYLRSLAQRPEQALAYYQTLQRPPPEPAVAAASTMAPKARLRWRQVEQSTTASESATAERQCWAELVQIFVRWHAKMPIEDILEMIGSTSTDAAPTSQASTVCAADAAMRSLLLLGRTDDALNLWRRSFEDEGLPPSGSSLSNFIWACNNEMAPDRALGVIDNWAVRYGVHDIVPKTVAEDAAMHFQTVLVRPTRDAATVPRIPLDAHLLKRLIATLGEAGGHATTALRLWRASEVRWGVRHSTGMLDELLHATAYGNWVRRDKELSVNHIDGSQRAPGQTHAFVDAADEVDWVHAPTSAFLRPATSAEAEPWEEARRVFETIHLSNWPELATVPHPFDEIHGPKLSPSLVVLSTTSITLNAELLRQGLPLTTGPTLAPSARTRGLPPPSLYSALSPTADTFHMYILLLKRHNWAGDIPLALAWMRARQIVPHEKTLKLAADALYRAACEGPLWHYVVTEAAREDDALCQEENIMFERVADLDEVAFIRKRRTKRPDLELVDWLRTWCPREIVPNKVRQAPFLPGSPRGHR